MYGDSFFYCKDLMPQGGRDAACNWGIAKENWAYVIFNISSIHFAVSLRPLKLCPSNLLHILPGYFTTAFCCRMFFIYSLGGPHD